MSQFVDCESWSSVNIKYFISADIEQEMRAAFENEAKLNNRAHLMSAAVSAGRDTIDSVYQTTKCWNHSFHS